MIHAKRWFQIVENDDFLQPRHQQEDVALEKSREYWYRLASLAYDYRDQGLAAEFTNPQRVLHKIPQFQGRPKNPYARPFGVSPNLALCVQASSTWRLTGDSDCDRIKQETTIPTLLQIGTSTAIPYGFYGKAFSHWIGTTTEKRTGPNYLGILTIGWCYVLSARLVEMRGDGASMRYTSSQASRFSESLRHPPAVLVVDVGEADGDVIRWWSAILAQHEGWKAIVKQTTSGEYLAPWSISRTCEVTFAIDPTGGSETSVQTPLSSDRALEALIQFARLHRLGSQFAVALATAMSFPTHQYYGSIPQLPSPKGHGGRVATDPLDCISLMRTNWKEQLPYFMTLSCSPEVLMSTLCGSFWEAGVPCNLASPWLHPVLEEVLGDMSVTNDRDQELLALLGAIRRPSVSALWIGAVISGFGPKIVQKVRRGRPPLDAVAFPWTGCPQSFMDIAGSGRYSCEDPEYISRPDVWRLLHLPSTEHDDLCYEYRPSTPWAPCGRSLTRNCALRVTAHLDCPRHEYQYDHWNWSLEDGTIIQDHGFATESPSVMTERPHYPDTKSLGHFEKKKLDRTASQEASLDIFRWFVVNGEGEPLEKVYRDDWVREIWEEDESGVEDRFDERRSQEPHEHLPQSPTLKSDDTTRL